MRFALPQLGSKIKSLRVAKTEALWAARLLDQLRDTCAPACQGRGEEPRGLPGRLGATDSISWAAAEGAQPGASSGSHPLQHQYP